MKRRAGRPQDERDLHVLAAVREESDVAAEAAFLRTRDTVFRRYGEKDYAGALAVAREAAARFPDRDATTTYWIACLAAQAGEPDLAVRTLREALERGLWWAGQLLLQGEHDLESLRERADFREIAAERDRQRLAAQASAAPDVLVIPPEPPGQGAAPPLVLALHMRNSSARESAPRWTPAAEAGGLLALAQSSQPFSSSGYCWDDEARSRSDLTWALDEVRRDRAFDSQRLIIAGASQGGKLAVTLAVQGALAPWRWFIAVVPSISDAGELLPLLAGAARRGVRGWLLTGERDRNRSGVEALHEHMTARGLDCVLDVVPGLGHDFPSNFGARLPAALAHVLA